MGTDPDNDPLTYTVQYSDHPFSQGPIINVITTSQFLDLSNLADNTTYYWTVSASDGKSNGTDVPTNIWSFTVRLPPANIPVRITSTPPLVAWVAKEYAYNITTVDEDGDIPSFSLLSPVANMTLDSSTGRLRWTPTYSDIGNHSVTVQVSDGRGSMDNQTFTIEVLNTLAPPIIAPRCAITYPANGSKVNGTIQIRGTAVNGSLPLTAIKVRIDSGSWIIVSGLDDWTFSLNTVKLSNGRHRIEAAAYAQNLSSDIVSINILVQNEEHGTVVEGTSWCLPFVVIAAITGIIIILVALRKRGR